MKMQLSLRAYVWALAAIVLFFACKNEKRVAPIPRIPTPAENGTGTPAPKDKNGVPAYVLDVLKYVRQHQEAPDGYVGGREFQNREKRLPAKALDGTKIRYREWDVYPKQRGVNRGAERLVTGSDQSAWYTPNHYKSFTKINQ